MMQIDINRKKKLYDMLYVLKLISLLICGIVIFTQFPEDYYMMSWANNTIGNNIVALNFIGFGTFVLICEGWLHSFKKDQIDQVYNISAFLESIVFMTIYTGLICISGFHESQYKFLYLFIIIVNTIQYGFNIGITTSIISAAAVLIIDILGYKTGVNKYFEADLVLSGVFVIMAWLLGYYVKLENQHRENALHLANIDELTGVYNHRYFQNSLSEHILESDKSKNVLGLLFIDIDHFKYYNDLYGHSAGDVVLNRLGDIFKRNVREYDVIARYGGEEFAIILPDTSEEEAVEIGNRLRDAVETTYFEGEENQPDGNLTISIGVSCYPLKAKNKKELINTADDALYRAKFFNKNRVESYYSVLEELKEDIEEKHIDLISSIKTLISVINAKDRYTYAHTDRVVVYCELMANHLNLSDNDRKTLRYGAYLHDIGKIQISKDVLNKIGKLTDEEWNLLKAHPENGAQIVRPVAALREVLPLILHHHERYDGTGYPIGIKGDEIPYLVRILSIADSFDAMTSNRPYHKRKTYEQAVDELFRCSSSQFDPDMVMEFVRMLENNRSMLDLI